MDITLITDLAKHFSLSFGDIVKFERDWGQLVESTRRNLFKETSP